MAKDQKRPAEEKLPEGFDPTKDMPPPYVGADGQPIPLAHFDNDQRYTGEPVDKSPGSLYDFIDQTMQDQIAAARPKAGERPTLYILGGRTCSGKGWFTGKNGTVDRSKAIYINNDDIKKSLPEYKGWNSGLLHEEASHIGEEMEKYARENRLNTIVEATLNSEEWLAKRIADYNAAGYRISGHFMYASPETAAERALARFARGTEEAKAEGKNDMMGHFVPPELILGSVKNEHNFDEHRDQMDYWEIYNNEAGGFNPKLHARKGG